MSFRKYSLNKKRLIYITPKYHKKKENVFWCFQKVTQGDSLLNKQRFISDTFAAFL